MSWPGGGTPRIAVIGGGIGGLATAAFLHRAGLPAVIYEQAAELKEIGAGLVIAPNAARLLRRLGVLSVIEQQAVRLETGWEFRRWADGTVLSAENLAARCLELYGEHTYAAHRADLLSAIRQAVPADAVRLGRRCSGLVSDGPRPVLEFTDGTAAEADVVIGADGVHSAIRDAVYGPSPATYSGICAFRALVPAEQAPPFALRQAQTLWLGPGHHLVHYPVSAGRYVNLVAFAPAGEYVIESWTATATVAEFLAEFADWDQRLVRLIEAVGTVGRWALLDREPLPQWSYGPVTLLGDAAHPMFPFFAQGAAQAMEDAAVLASCLAAALTTGNGSPADVAAALRRYEECRRPRTTRLQEISHARAHVNHLPDGVEQAARDAAFGATDPLTASGWIYGYDPDTELAAPRVG
ncbi:MAG: FAD-dependent monooxygenase [Trebonia sp.]